MHFRSGPERGARVALALALVTVVPTGAAAQDPEPAAAPTLIGLEPEPPPTWRFKRDDKPVKVVVLAGSIGAWPKQPYARELERLCSNVEVHNLSRVGQGALALKQRFKHQVVQNRRVHAEDPALEHWLVYGGGLNSVGTPKSTNKHMRDLFVAAHDHGFRVIGLSLTPWGDLHDRRWRGEEGLEHRRVTQNVVDFNMGRLTPEQALGEYGAKRPGGVAAPWDPRELPDIAIDLYDSALRDREAPLGELEAAKTSLAKDKRWKQAHAKLDEAGKATQLELDAAALAELPRWFLRKELRSFDHIHPNTEGHRIIAATVCPKLPASWGCSCEPVEAAAVDDATP
jgi:hypothetical protein